MIDVEAPSLEAPNEVEAIVGGYHGDAFRILGPHALPGSLDVATRWAVRAFLPHASKAEVVLEGVSTPMEKKHDHGFFTAYFDHQPTDYRFRVHLWNGEVEVIDDAYRFPPLLTDFDLYLHGEGTNYESYNTLGAHIVTSRGVTGVRFAVWAPNAEVVCAVGDFNHWDTRRHPMRLRSGGIWELFVPGIGAGVRYKYYVRSRHLGHRQLKADPYGFASEVPPKSASIVADLQAYTWNDQQWMASRAAKNWLKEPMSVYEVHLESWMRGPNGDYLTYRELASSLVQYVVHMGFTHIELLPIMEHP
ncbi:MAG TPA: 1,4-alpha-glucan branching enzyme, partial [Bryobacteraceae bacterium]|nr:1,4-alpha-glucan branching enzyme [Bryobacteraceae bacterium]